MGSRGFRFFRSLRFIPSWPGRSWARTPPNFTQADFENQFEFFGFSHGASTFGQNNESTRKVATQVAGALTIENNGNDEVYLGAEMGWSLYSIDPDTRKKELENAPELHWGKKHKMGAVWKVIPYGERSYFLHDALTQTFEDKFAESPTTSRS